jgi:hypothetical protein
LQTHIAKHLTPFFGEYSLKDITPGDGSALGFKFNGPPKDNEEYMHNPAIALANGKGCGSSPNAPRNTSLPVIKDRVRRR